MEAVIGINFNDFSLIAADTHAVFSIIFVKNDVDKIYTLSDNLLMGVIGEAGDTAQFAEFISKNIQLFKIRNGFELSPKCAALFIQRNVADYLRSRTPYHCNLVLAGYDKEKGPQMFYIDYLATLAELPYVVHGYPMMFTLGLLDKDYRPDMTEEEAIKLMTDCIYEINTRFVGSLKNYVVKKLDANGVKRLPDICVTKPKNS